VQCVNGGSSVKPVLAKLMSHDATWLDSLTVSVKD
jgi:hypothetical protein